MIKRVEMFRSTSGATFESEREAWRDDLKTFLAVDTNDGVAERLVQAIESDLPAFGQMIDGLRGITTPSLPSPLDDPLVAQMRDHARPVPPDVYFHEGNFYGRSRKGKGRVFFAKWQKYRHYFPQSFEQLVTDQVQPHEPFPA